MRTHRIVWTTLAAAVAAATIAAAASPAATVLDRLRALEGQWDGTYAWSGSRSGRGTLTATYTTTGRESAIIETLSFDHGAMLMTSVYHLDGDDLRMTHYCGRANQPRLKATAIDRDGRSARFAFVDATNLRGPDDAHVHAVTLEFPAPDRVTIQFTFTSPDGQGYERIELKRRPS